MQAQRRLKELITNRVMELVSMQHDIKISMLLRVLKCCSDIRQHYKELLKFDEVNLETDDPKEVSDEFQDLSLEFVYASFQTISSSLCAIAICLGQHPEVVQNISDELESLDIGAKSDSAHSITHANVMSATYTNYVMKEVMRLYPPIAGAFRTTLEPMEIMVNIFLCYNISPDIGVLYMTHSQSIYRATTSLKVGRYSTLYQQRISSQTTGFTKKVWPISSLRDGNKTSTTS